MPFAGNNTNATISYNGVPFNKASSVKVDIEYVEDEAGRATVYHRHVATIAATVCATTNNALETEMSSIKSKLSRQGKSFILANAGFGTNFTVNYAGGRWDVKFGPKPKILSWSPAGGNLSADIEWQVEFCLSPCGTTAPLPGVMAFNYEVQYDVDEAGDQIRTITGYYEIAQTRNDSDGISQTADAFANQLIPDTIAGFHRTRSRNLSLDKSRMDFTVTDTQIKSRNAYPPGVINVEAKHRVMWTRERSAMQLTNLITFSAEVANGHSPKLIYQYFQTLVAQRITRLVRAKQTPIFTGLDIEEDIFGRGVGFAARYRVLCSLKDLDKQSAKNNFINLITNSGLFDPTGTDWDAWKKSLENIRTYNGTAKLTTGPQDDAIIDLCHQTPIPLSQKPYLYSVKNDTNRTDLIRNPYPDPVNSWLDYKDSIESDTDKPAYSQSIVQPDTDVTIPDQPEATNEMTEPPASAAASSGSGVSAGEDIIDKSGNKRHTIVYSGSAQRAGYAIPRPSLNAAVGPQLTEYKSYVRIWKSGTYFGVPIWNAKWKIIYLLPKGPGVIRPRPTLNRS